VLADEPTGNLDVEAGAEVLRLRAVADEGRAVVMVTHEAAAAGSPIGCCGSRTGAWRDRLAPPLRARRRRWRWPRPIAAASIVVGTCATAGFGLATGFERAADRADLLDVTAAERRRSPTSTAA
jgi:hypothetical protein